ncbi:hypothetical protein [Deefgea sp. CFH1-16]|uniref:hypothetical protein n=1 Tax=Deefgea sp. CFH1-16 TaxID=2675457 RepID=UPI00194030A6|nr:hypothetical protein [Deefgea sp. CFH1-16]
MSNTAYQNARTEVVVPLASELDVNESAPLVSPTPFAQANEIIATHEESRWNSQLGRYQTNYVIQKTVTDETGQPLYIVGLDFRYFRAKAISATN